ncbi:hypothetical protein [Lysobacter hankyongensis]|uniref:Alginate export domain-containing protein n=1 Tax=Lysobacter hankyongensis TaxID=1176535 RepID=A0ABP9BQ69_9GAMM
MAAQQEAPAPAPMASDESGVEAEKSDEAGDAAGSGLDLSGYASVRARHDLEEHGDNASRASVVAVIRANLALDVGKLSAQLRPEFVRSSRSGDRVAQVRVDEANWEKEIAASSFVFAGRRRIVNGVALGRNPTDFLNLDKPEDRTLADEDRRAEKKGDDLVGWSHFGQAYSVQAAVVSPEDGSDRVRALVQLTGRIDAVSTDYSLIGYYAENPGVGLNLSTVIGDKMTAYAEMALRSDRDRPRPVADAQNALVGTAEDRDGWFADVVVGGQYTSDAGWTFTAEYWRNANGYSDAEFSSLERSLRTGLGDPGLAGSLIATPELRREKMFFRISDVKLRDNVELETTMIHGFDDDSRFVRGAVIWDVADADAIKAGVDVLSGSAFSEYGASPVETRIFLIYKRYF